MATKLKIVLGALTLGLILSGCRKTKLKDEYAIFEGKWKWVGALEIRTSFATGSVTYIDHLASDYPDSYFMEFERKGYVSFYKNNEMELSYRVVIRIFFDNCNDFPGCHFFGMRLDNDKEKSFSGFVGYDTLLCGSTHTNLPLIFHTDNNYEYDYWHKFEKIN